LWFIIALASLAALIIIVLCIPVELIFRANTEGRPKFILRLILFFGLFNMGLRQAAHKPERRKVSREKPDSNWWQRIKLALEILQTKGLLKQLINFMMRTCRRVKVKELAANLKVDLDNPADTGLLFAYIAPANLLTNYLLPYQIKIEPSFTGESFVTGYVNARVKLMPIQVVASATGFAFSPPFFRAAKKLVMYRWKRKK
jgi:hypothetical protein